MLLARRRSDAFPSLWNNIWNNDLDWFFNPVNYKNSHSPAVNISESDDAYSLEVAVPGANKNDFKIEVNNGVLTVSADKKVENKSEEQDYSKREFYYKSFSRSFELPEGKIIEDKIKAKYENGILFVNLPKDEKAQVQAIREIKVS